MGISSTNIADLFEDMPIMNKNIILPVIDLFYSDQYKNNFLRLRDLYETGRLHILETNCTHRWT